MTNLLQKIKKFYPRIEIYEKFISLIFWLAAIFYLSAQPGLFSDGVSIFDFIIRKLAHMFEFGILALLIFRLLNHLDNKVIKLNLLLALVLSIAYAILDEFHQSIVYGRVGIWWDVLIDTAGILIAIWLIACAFKIVSLKYSLKLKVKS